MSDSIRIRTTPNGTDKYLKVKLEQDFDFIEILSLKISQDKAYQNFCSDYGVIVGRVIVNNGFGVPNAKVSVFIPIDDTDKNNPNIKNYYPYERVTDTDDNGVRYNLLPKENNTDSDCYTPVGTFPSKREILDNDDISYVYCKYYKFNAVTNYAGDFMIFGVPLGEQVVHIDVDISDIGFASQRPYDLIGQGTPEKFFYSPSKFKKSENLNSLLQIKSTNIGVNVQPFWGDMDNCEIGINRVDFDLNYNLIPSAIFTGSLFGDSDKNSVNKRCKPRKDLGTLCEQYTGEGTIEMIRKTSDNQIEEFNVQGGRVIDENGTWAYQIPMNLDYVITDELGNLVPSDDSSVGIPTRASVRFRISMDEFGGIGRLRTRGKHLVPHNPASVSDLDFEFGKQTKDTSFADMYFNKIYTVKNFIAKVQRSGKNRRSKSFIGIKNVDNCTGTKTPFPFNRAFTRSNVIFTIICFIVNVLATIVYAINTVICLIRAIGFSFTILGVNISWYPFGDLPLVPLPCPSDPEKTFYPGPCADGLAEYTNCVSAVLAEELGIYQLDFYNDWINGTLYYYLLKYKKRRRSKRDKFCEYKCTDFQGGTGHNSCKTNQIADTTVAGYTLPAAADADAYDYSFRNGLLVSYNDELYYPPITLNGNAMKMYATDLYNLGSTIDCDWQGMPKIIQYVTETTYKIPPLIKEGPEEPNDDQTITSGMFSDNNTAGLFFGINCLGVFYNQDQATNIRRLCEIGVDIPETNLDVYTNEAQRDCVTMRDIFDAGDIINGDNTSVSKYVRDVLYFLNTSGPSINSYPPISPVPNLDIPSNGTSFRYDEVCSHNNGSAYMNYRKFTFTNVFPDTSTQTANSYYFYFGLTAGKTAINKLMSTYFSTCDRTVPEEYIIETNVSNTTTASSNNGSITLTFLGGVGPFTYTVTGPNYTNGPATTNSTATISGLYADTYTINAYDSSGTIVIKDVVISGPQALSCSFSIQREPDNINASNGILDAFIFGGTQPYTVTILPPNGTLQTISNFTQSQIQNIRPGNNTITVIDSSSPQQTCQQTINVTTIPPLVLNVPQQNIGNIPCNQNCTGSIRPLISGGSTPYTIRVQGPNGYDISGPSNTTYFNNLCEGAYTVTATDSATVPQVVTTQVTLIKIQPPQISDTQGNINRNIKQCNSNRYTIQVYIQQGTYSAPYTLNYSIDNGIQTSVNINQNEIVNNIYTLIITQQINISLTITVEDNVERCVSNTISYIATDIKRPTQVLSVSGTRAGNYVTMNANGGITPYTYTPSQIVYSPTGVIPRVTDSVGCTATGISI